MKKIGKLGRRHFLMGAGGFTLALPMLPSLLSNEARAQAHQQKRFVAIATFHGGVPEADMFPADAVADQTHGLFDGHVAHHGALPRVVDGDTASLSPVLRAPAHLLTDALAAKMNVVRGLGIMTYMGHHSGGHLGNFGRNDGNPFQLVPTIDQVMAWSDSFYPDLGGVVQRSVHVDTRRDGGFGVSWGYTDPASQAGSVVELPNERSAQDLFDRLFGDVSSEPPPDAPRRPLVDRVLDHYRGMTSGRFGDAGRISAADRRRLDEHMDRMSELQRRLGTRSRVSCGAPVRPEPDAGFSRARGFQLESSPVDEANNAAWYGIYNDVLATAIMCNVTSLATIYSREPFVHGWSGSDWHERVAHSGDGARLGRHVTSMFEHVFVDLARKLDVEEADGRTYLDNSLIQLTQESGMNTHFSLEMPLVTAGGAGGALQTGRFVDYRYRESTDLGRSDNFRQGLTWNQWLANVLLAMGVPATEFERGGNPGYGDLRIDDNYSDAFHSGMVRMASDPLPLLAA